MKITMYAIIDRRGQICVNRKVFPNPHTDGKPIPEERREAWIFPDIKVAESIVKNLYELHLRIVPIEMHYSEGTA